MKSADLIEQEPKEFYRTHQVGVWSANQDDNSEVMARAESGPWLFTLGIMFTGDTSFTKSLSSEKLLCSLYGTSYLYINEIFYYPSKQNTLVWWFRYKYANSLKFNVRTFKNWIVEWKWKLIVLLIIVYFDFVLYLVGNMSFVLCFFKFTSQI